MRVLQLANKPPWPPVEGGPMAMNAITMALLSRGFEVKILAVSTPKFNVKPGDVPEEFRKRTSFETIFVNTGIKPLHAILHLFSGRSYIVSRFYSRTFRKRLEKVLSEFRPEIVIMESMFMWRYLPAIKKINPSSGIILRAHNIEHVIWERIAAGERGVLRKLVCRYLAKCLRREELEASSGFDGIIAITEVDAEWFKSRFPSVPVLSLPFGIETGDDDPCYPIIPPLKMYHLGSMNWFPNIEAVQWLVDLCREGMLDNFPQVELHLAGRNMAASLVKYDHERLKVHGEVPSSKEFINDKHVLAAPIFSGSGLRIKILEAMAMGRAVITTSTGAEGIKYTDGSDIIIADTPDDFLKAIKMLNEDPSNVERIGRAARSLIAQQYNPGRLALQLREFLINYEDSFSNPGVQA